MKFFAQSSGARLVLTVCCAAVLLLAGTPYLCECATANAELVDSHPACCGEQSADLPAPSDQCAMHGDAGLEACAPCAISADVPPPGQMATISQRGADTVRIPIVHYVGTFSLQISHARAAAEVGGPLASGHDSSLRALASVVLLS